MIQITIIGNELLDFIKVEPGFDQSVPVLLATAISEAQAFLNTDFYGEEAPAPVKAWVFNRVSQLHETRGSIPVPNYAMLQAYRVYPFRGEYTGNTVPSVRRC